MKCILCDNEFPEERHSITGSRICVECANEESKREEIRSIPMVMNAGSELDWQKFKRDQETQQQRREIRKLIVQRNQRECARRLEYMRINPIPTRFAKPEIRPWGRGRLSSGS